MTRVPALRIRSGSTRSAPARTIMPVGLGPSLLPLPVGVHVQLAACEWQRRALLVAAEEHAIDARDEREELPFIRRLNHEHAAAFVRREAAVVQVVAVHGDQRPAE